MVFWDSLYLFLMIIAPLICHIFKSGWRPPKFNFQSEWWVMENNFVKVHHQYLRLLLRMKRFKSRKLFVLHFFPLWNPFLSLNSESLCLQILTSQIVLLENSVSLVVYWQMPNAWSGSLVLQPLNHLTIFEENVNTDLWQKWICKLCNILLKDV